MLSYLLIDDKRAHADHSAMIFLTSSKLINLDETWQTDGGDRKE